MTMKGKNSVIEKKNWQELKYVLTLLLFPRYQLCGKVRSVIVLFNGHSLFFTSHKVMCVFGAEGEVEGCRKMLV